MTAPWMPKTVDDFKRQAQDPERATGWGVPPKDLGAGVVEVGTRHYTDNAFSIHLRPWMMNVQGLKTCAWRLVNYPDRTNRIQWFRIDPIEFEGWPFVETPPNPRLTADVAGKGEHEVIVNVTPTPRGEERIVRYAVTIAFKDENGNVRLAVVDPDIVVDV